MRIVLSLVALLVAGCGAPDADFEPIPLLDPFALTPVDVDADPLAHHRPSEVSCPLRGGDPRGEDSRFKRGVTWGVRPTFADSD